MKKSIIAAGAASVALAAMPIVGAFAVSNVTDTITATVDSGCVIDNATATNTVDLGTITPGEDVSSESGKASSGITVTCNATSWNVNAVGASEGDHPSSMYTAGGAEIATGTATSGDTSAWMFKIAANSATEEAVTPATGFATWHVIPAPAAETGAATTVAVGSKAATATIIPTYRVYASSSQATGSYTGKVTYNVSSN